MDPPPPPPATAPAATVPPSSSSTTTALPHLALLPPSEPHTFVPPTKCINTGTDLPHFFASQAYHDICTFILQLNRALCPRKTTVSTTSSDNTNTRRAGATKEPVKTFPLTSPRHDPPSVIKLRDLLNKVEEIINEVPPEAGPRRFGNAAFRRWHGVLNGRVEGLIREYLAETQTGWDVESEGLLAELKAYFMGGFGSAQRLDYGTGHELSFLAFLGGLWKLGVFEGEDHDGEVERSVVLGVFEPYLKVVRRLILTYNLEPAGTHGVWGLDDHSFLPYIFGSAQLTRPIADGEPMPKEGSVLGAPKPAAVAKADSVALYRDSNMYFSAVGFINDVKRGPFWEHSPMLFDISGIKDGWGKVNKGMIKMFNAEVLGKFPVVQHFPFGSLFSWDLDPNADSVLQSAHLASHDVAGTGAVPGTAAPWAQSAGGMPGAGVPSGPGIPYSRAPWAQTGSAGPALPRGGIPDTGPPPPTSFPRGVPGQASNQISVTKAPWAK